jgi:hypothetical protein
MGVPPSSRGDRGGVTPRSTSLPLSVRFRFFLANSRRVLIENKISFKIPILKGQQLS